jgi:RNA polymerase-binding transcription factor DksA
MPPLPAGPWRWHQQALLDLQTQLQQGRNAHRETAREPLEPHSLSEADSATDELDHDLALAQLAHEDNALFEIHEALRRIAEGRYGICEISGQPIGAERLRAVPWTRFTCEVERRLESSGAGPRVALPRPGTVRGRKEFSFEAAGEPEEAPEAADETLGQPRPSPPGGTASSQRPATGT